MIRTVPHFNSLLPVSHLTEIPDCDAVHGSGGRGRGALEVHNRSLANQRDLTGPTTRTRFGNPSNSGAYAVRQQLHETRAVHKRYLGLREEQHQRLTIQGAGAVRARCGSLRERVSRRRKDGNF